MSRLDVAGGSLMEAGADAIMLHGFWKTAGKGKFVKQRQQLCTVVRLAATYAVVSLLASALVIPPALAAGLAARPDRVITAGTVTERDLSGALESVTTTTGTKLKLDFRHVEPWFEYRQLHRGSRQLPHPASTRAPLVEVHSGQVIIHRIRRWR